MADTGHDISEFADLPWAEMEIRRETGGQGGNWSFGRAGDGSWQITIVYPDMSADIWELPEPLWVMLEMQYRFGCEEVQREIRDAIGL